MVVTRDCASHYCDSKRANLLSPTHCRRPASGTHVYMGSEFPTRDYAERKLHTHTHARAPRAHNDDVHVTLIYAHVARNACLAAGGRFQTELDHVTHARHRLVAVEDVAVVLF